MSGVTYLAENQEWIEKCRSAKLDTIQDILDNIPLIYSLKESLRLAPPIPLNVMRHVVKPAEFAGIKVQPGDLITYGHGGVCEIEEFFENPKKFNPDRYYNKEWEEKLPRTLNIPFGFGRRSCMGKDIALIELPIYLARILSRFDIKLPENYERKFECKFGYKSVNTELLVKLRNK